MTTANTPAPRKGTTGVYKGTTPFEVLRVEGAICYARYDSRPEGSSFIWRFKDGLNTLHDWPGKNG